MMPGGLRIMLCATPMDMRASFDGLARAVQERLAIDAQTEKAMYVFINKRRDMVKMLWRDATGWCLLAKRLERRLIELPKTFAAGQTSHLIDGRTLSTLMDGVEIRRQTRRDVAHEARAAVERRIVVAPPQPFA